MNRGKVTRLDLLRRIHGSIERVNRELGARVPAGGRGSVPALAELERQRQHVSRLVAHEVDARALLHP